MLFIYTVVTYLMDFIKILMDWLLILYDTLFYSRCVLLLIGSVKLVSLVNVIFR